MEGSDREDGQPLSPSAPVENTVSGMVAGASVEAGAIYGRVHLHQVQPDVLVPRQLVAAPSISPTVFRGMAGCVGGL